MQEEYLNKSDLLKFIKAFKKEFHYVLCTQSNKNNYETPLKLPYKKRLEFFEDNKEFLRTLLKKTSQFVYNYLLDNFRNRNVKIPYFLDEILFFMQYDKSDTHLKPVINIFEILDIDIQEESKVDLNSFLEFLKIKLQGDDNYFEKLVFINLFEESIISDFLIDKICQDKISKDNKSINESNKIHHTIKLPFIKLNPNDIDDNKIEYSKFQCLFNLKIKYSKESSKKWMEYLKSTIDDCKIDELINIIKSCSNDS